MFEVFHNSGEHFLKISNAACNTLIDISLLSSGRASVHLGLQIANEVLVRIEFG